MTRLRQAVTKERVDPRSFAALPEGFYQSIAGEMADIPVRDRERIEQILSSFTRARVTKIVRFASTTELTPELSGMMTAEEKELYSAIREAVARFSSSLEKKDVA